VSLMRREEPDWQVLRGVWHSRFGKEALRKVWR
jgi:hypothetical protein